MEAIQLQPDEYWKLRALAREVDALAGERAQFVLQHTEIVRKACQSRDACAKELMDRYGFNIADYTLDDAMHGLIPVRAMHQSESTG